MPLAIWAVACGSLLNPAAHATDATTETERLNVILISLDTVRPDHLSCYGYHRTTSPHLDQLAKDSVLFTQAYAQAPVTLSSHLSLFTSRYPKRSWIHQQTVELDPSTGTLSEQLKQAGYRLARFTNFWHPRFRSVFASRVFHAFEEGVPGEGVALKALPQELFDWLQVHHREPFFLFLHGRDAHDPHLLPIQYDATRFNPAYRGGLISTTWEYRTLIASALGEEGLDGQPREVSDMLRDKEPSLRWRSPLEITVYTQHVTTHLARPEGAAHLQALYDAELYYLDQGLGQLFVALKNLGLMERTLLVILSDHGEAFGEHGRHAFHADCYNEVTRMVLLIRDPRLARRGRRVSQLVQGLDVMPTILELLDLPVPPSVQGRSLVPLLRTGRDPGRTERAISVWRGLRALRTPRWMLLVKEETPAELYDRRADPQEQHNILDRHPDVVTQLHRQLDRLVPAEAAGELVDSDQWMQQHGYW